MNIPEELKPLMADRQTVYGDPEENHRGIAQMWVCLLQPWADKISRMEPLPWHVVALMMVALKLNRMRRVYKDDNYADLRVHLGIAEKGQKQYDAAEAERKAKSTRSSEHGGLDAYKNDPNAHYWKMAVDQSLVCALDKCSENYPNTYDGAMQAINDLIRWHEMVALDPAVSEEARKLRDTYKEPKS